MNAALVSIIFTSLAAGATYFLAPRGEYGKIRILVIWVVSALLAFIVPEKLAVLFGAGLVMIFATPAQAQWRVYIYIATLGALPAFYTANIPFPGINYLVGLDLAKISAIVLLGPVFVSKIFTKTPQQLRTVDTILFVYCLLAGFLTIRDLPFTSMLRAVIDQFILVVMPYIAISRSLLTQKEIERGLKALLAGILMVSFIGLISTLRNWNYYADLADSINYKVYAERRNGLLRIGSTLVGPMLGYLAGVGAACVLYLRAKSERLRAPTIAFLGLFFFVMFATGSRGGWLAGILVLVVYFSVLNFGATGRKLFIVSLCAGIVIMLTLVFQESTLISDEHGTFDYRAELLRTSVQQISRRPLFGSSEFLTDGSFEHLRQGEGIIDLVNTYLQISLFNGLVGLGLYLAANFLTLRSSLGLLGETEKKKSRGRDFGEMRRATSLLIGVHISYLVLITTVSAVSYIWHYGYIILGLVVAQVRVGALPQVTQERRDDAPPKQESPSTLKPYASLPYGARFVRRS